MKPLGLPLNFWEFYLIIYDIFREIILRSLFYQLLLTLNPLSYLVYLILQPFCNFFDIDNFFFKMFLFIIACRHSGFYFCHKCLSQDCCWLFLALPIVMFSQSSHLMRYQYAETWYHRWNIVPFLFLKGNWIKDQGVINFRIKIFIYDSI